VAIQRILRRQVLRQSWPRRPSPRVVHKSTCKNRRRLTRRQKGNRAGYRTSRIVVSYSLLRRHANLSHHHILFMN
jgi:hypothetical protein